MLVCAVFKGALTGNATASGSSALLTSTKVADSEIVDKVGRAADVDAGTRVRKSAPH